MTTGNHANPGRPAGWLRSVPARLLLLGLLPMIGLVALAAARAGLGRADVATGPDGRPL